MTHPNDAVMFQKLLRKFERNFLGKDPHYQDPYDDPAEQFYARIYLKYLFEQIDSEFRHQRIRVLDIGCHTGRLAIPLALAGHQVTGVDASRFHTRRARDHAQTAGVRERTRFVKGDGFRFARKVPPGSYDLVLCTEVLYQRPQFQSDLAALHRAVRTGGLLAASHRTRFFYLIQAVRQRDFKTAERLLNQNEGELWGSYFNWQTPAELKSLYQKLKMEPLLIRPIGVFTGNGGDGMAQLCDLSQVSEEEREALFDVEAFDSDEFASSGRYLLVVARKI